MTLLDAGGLFGLLLVGGFAWAMLRTERTNRAQRVELLKSRLHQAARERRDEAPVESEGVSRSPGRRRRRRR